MVWVFGIMIMTYEFLYSMDVPVGPEQTKFFLHVIAAGVVAIIAAFLHAHLIHQSKKNDA